MANVPQESDHVGAERHHVHPHHYRDHAFSQRRRLRITIETVPVTLFVVATVIAETVGVMFATIGVVNRAVKIKIVTISIDSYLLIFIFGCSLLTCKVPIFLRNLFRRINTEDCCKPRRRYRS